MIHFATSKHFLIETGNQIIEKVKNINPGHLILGSEVKNEESDTEMDEINEENETVTMETNEDDWITGITGDGATENEDIYMDDDLTNRRSAINRRRQKKKKGNFNCNSEVIIVKPGC